MVYNNFVCKNKPFIYIRANDTVNKNDRLNINSSKHNI